MHDPWTVEFWRLGLLSLAAALVGLLFGDVLTGLLLGLLAFGAWHLLWLYRFQRWLARGEKEIPDNVSGVWEEIYLSLYRLRKRNRKRKKKLVSILNRFYESASAMPDATVVLEGRGIIEWWNDAASRLLGLKAPYDVGQRIDNLIRFPVFIDYLNGGDFTERVEFPSPLDETVTLSGQIVPYGNEQRLLVVRDVTRIRQLEHMRRDFVANISHELKTPLTVIGGFLEAMEDSGEPAGQRWRRSVQLMSQQTERMRRIVDDLLFLSRLEVDGYAHQETAVNIPSLLAGIREEAIALSGERRHQVDLEMNERLFLRGNEMELRSAFANLVCNAVHYTPAGGQIRIRWYNGEAGAYLEVRDTGIGIPTKHLNRITERFYRVDVSRSRESGGTGLGLAIVKHVLSRHQASLQVDSVEGKGSTFTCMFPAERMVIGGQPAAVPPRLIQNG